MNTRTALLQATPVVSDPIDAGPDTMFHPMFGGYGSYRGSPVEAHLMPGLVEQGAIVGQGPNLLGPGGDGQQIRPPWWPPGKGKQICPGGLYYPDGSCKPGTIMCPGGAKPNPDGTCPPPPVNNPGGGGGSGSGGSGCPAGQILGPDGTTCIPDPSQTIGGIGSGQLGSPLLSYTPSGAQQASAPSFPPGLAVVIIAAIALLAWYIYKHRKGERAPGDEQLRQTTEAAT